MQFKDIEGQQDTISRLTEIIDSGRVSHAQMVLGAYKSFEYKKQTATLHKGARLLLYTDGVTEERSPQGKFFGTDGLLEWVRACPREWSARQVCDSLLETLANYRGGEQQSDDIAIMCIKL